MERVLYLAVEIFIILFCLTLTASYLTTKAVYLKVDTHTYTDEAGVGSKVNIGPCPWLLHPFIFKPHKPHYFKSSSFNSCYHLPITLSTNELIWHTIGLKKIIIVVICYKALLGLILLLESLFLVSVWEILVNSHGSWIAWYQNNRLCISFCIWWDTFMF